MQLVLALLVLYIARAAFRDANYELSYHIVMKASQRVAEQKVYADFFTNAAVAWFTAGIIVPSVSTPKSAQETGPSVFIGLIGTVLSLVTAVSFLKKTV